MKKIRGMLTNTRGASMAMVLVIAVLILVIGGAVMLFGSSNIRTQVSKTQQEKLYYEAKSTVEVVSQAIMDGEAGDYLKAQVLGDLRNSGKTEVAKTWNLTDVSMDLEGPGVDDLTFEDVTITFDSLAQGTKTFTTLTKANISITNLRVSYTVRDSLGNSYSSTLTFSYNGWWNSGLGGGNWTNEQWELISTDN